MKMFHLDGKGKWINIKKINNVNERKSYQLFFVYKITEYWVIMIIMTIIVIISITIDIYFAFYVPFFHLQDKVTL